MNKLFLTIFACLLLLYIYQNRRKTFLYRKDEIEMQIVKPLTPKMLRMFKNDLGYTKGAQHCHSQNSMDDAITTEREICDVAVELGAKAAFISDHGTAMGWDDFDEAAKKVNAKLTEQGIDRKIKPIFGVEAYYLDDVTQMKSHLVLYAMNERGLYKIRMALSRGVIIANPRDEENGFNCLTDETLEYLKGGDVIATSACIQGVIGSIVMYNNKLNTKIERLEDEINAFADSLSIYEESQRVFDEANERLSILKAEVSEAKAASKKSFTSKQKQLDGMKKKLEKAKAAFDKFLADGKDASAKSVRVALAQLEVVVEDSDEFQNGIEEAEMKYNQRAAQLRSEAAKTKEMADTLDAKTTAMEKAKTERAEAKAALDAVAKDVAKVENKRAKIEEFTAQKLTREQSQELVLKRLAKMKEIFGDNFYMEVQNHGLDLEAIIYPWVAKVAKKHKIPLIAANDAHMARNTTDDMSARQIRRSCRFKRWEEIEEDFCEYYIKNDLELAAALYQILPEDMVIEAMTNVAKVVDSCNAVIAKESHAPKAKLPNVKDEIIRIARANIARKYGAAWSKEHEERFAYEIGIIDSMGFNDYFYITWDILNVARLIGGLSYEKLDELKSKMGGMNLDELMVYLNQFSTEPNISVGLGRGSGAGSIVCFLLGITNIDPFKYDLLFERKKDCVH
jgi:DNA polymerase-3 subunit alpha